MLEPSNRSILTEMLQPPTGFTLAHAVGTTFTLDLSTALSVPVSFATRRLESEDDVGILAMLTRYSNRINIFTQAGAITRGLRSDLVSLLEQVVHPVESPRGIFHPKVWVLEYTSPGATRYRLLNLSRNLTEDTSWDLSVQLDGIPAQPEDLQKTKRVNEPLTTLLKTLPGLAIRPLSLQAQAAHSAFIKRVSSVSWKPPEGVRDLGFHVGGIDRRSPLPNIDTRDLLIISPFVSDAALTNVATRSSQNVTLVSRTETLDGLLPESTSGRVKTYAFETGLRENPAEESFDSSVEQNTAPKLNGLHAKAVFAKVPGRRDSARAFIGSMNLTDAGLNRNVEFTVELEAPNRILGPEKVLNNLLGDDDDPALIVLYTPRPENETDKLEEASRQLDIQLRNLATKRWNVKLSDGDTIALRVWADDAAHKTWEQLIATGVDLSWSLFTRRNQKFMQLATEERSSTLIGQVELFEVTPFIEITATQEVNGTTITRSTVVLAQIHNDRKERIDEILTRRILDRDGFLRMLLLLLGSDALGETLIQSNTQGNSSLWGAAFAEAEIFETLVRAIGNDDDDAFEFVSRMIARMRASEEGATQLPPEFLELWENVVIARKLIRT